MKEFTPDKYLGHKINRISRSIDRYFDRKRCSKTEMYTAKPGMMIGYIMDNQGQNIFQKDIEAKFHLSVLFSLSFAPLSPASFPLSPVLSSSFISPNLLFP